MNKEFLLTRACIAFCLIALALLYRDLANVVWTQAGGVLGALQALIVGLAATGLVYGSLVYLVARCGQLRRETPKRSDLSEQFDRLYGPGSTPPRVCILIPSYKEQIGVVRQTLLSAALAEYPVRRIVVLIDDPVAAAGRDLLMLRATRDLVITLNDQFHALARRFYAEYSDSLLRAEGEIPCDPNEEAQQLAALYESLASWVEELADGPVQAAGIGKHVNKFFREQIVYPAADAHRARAQRLRQGIHDTRGVQAEYRRLIGLVKVEISAFERKQYENLSHAPNKAMNLNSYIGLMGKRFRVSHGAAEQRLEESRSPHADLIVPDADFLLTLDADSLIRHDYLLKLTAILERDSSIAVAQTPYSAIPGSRNRLERAAGAQTDVQYLVHQGFTHFQATFWVGANALLRVSALRDIQTTTVERGHVIPVFIQDLTVIEDTGSTIDLIGRGWRLHNHPERLAYSATPTDFGSLIIQRRRWSNGGLIILRDLLRYASEGDSPRPSIAETLLRTHYLCSPAIAGISVFLLLLLPLDHVLASPWLAATALPYYVLYARDLLRSGYRWSELPQVYALSLMLLPVNLAGVLRSVQQIVTGQKSSFGRTPKVDDRTAMHPLHVGLQFALALGTALVAGRYVLHGHYYLAAFCLMNFACLLAGLSVFIGLRHAVYDAGLGRSMSFTPMSAERRILPMEGLRAYAVVLVFLVHFLAQYYNGTTGPQHFDFDSTGLSQIEGLPHLAAYYLWASHYGVDLFFFISGFLIFKVVSKDGFNYPTFLIHRAARLYPAFLVALGIYLVYVAIFWKKTFDWPTIAMNLLMFQGIWELRITPILVPTWSLSFEWIFYLVFPLVLLVGRSQQVRPTFLLMILTALLLTLVVPLGVHYIRFLMFLSGALLACFPLDGARMLAGRISDATVLGIYVVGNLLFVWKQNYVYFIPVYALTCFLLVAKVVYGSGFLHRAFGLKGLRSLGNVSYSFYLVHGLVIVVVCDHVAPLLVGLIEPARFLLLLAFSFAVSSGVAAISYTLLERPYFKHKG